MSMLPLKTHVGNSSQGSSRKLSGSRMQGGKDVAVANGLHCLRCRNLSRMPGRARRHRMAAVSESYDFGEVIGCNIRKRCMLRASRLEGLLLVRKIYRNFIRAGYLLDQPSPVSQEIYAQFEEESKQNPPVDDEERIERDKEMKWVALKIVAEMQLTSEELANSLNNLQDSTSQLFPADSADSAVEIIRNQCAELSTALKRRVVREIPGLPFPSKYIYRAVADGHKRQPINRFLDNGTISSPIKRLEKVEKAAGKFVTVKLQEVSNIPPEDYIGNIQDTAVYLKEFWDRLNGGGRSSARPLLDENIPRAVSTEDVCKTAMSQLSLELERIEKQLQEASKAREAKLRQTGLKERLKLAFQLKIMDDEVLKLTRLLAVRSLQLQMEYIYSYLEEEAMDISEDARAFGRITRQGSTEELSVFAAEFNILDEQLSTLIETLTQTPSALVQDNLLQDVVDEIDDLMRRLGISPEMVLGVSGLGLRKVELQLQEAQAKLAEGGMFLVKGTRLFGSDLSNSSKLFYRAALGGTLKPREVAALRRTFRDLFTFVPFIVILLIPLTPFGHVLVFGFIQRYFPDLFPSQFTTRRQNIMTRYDFLRQELIAAQSKAEEAEEEAELVRAQEAVARLTAPPLPASIAPYTDGGGVLDRLRRLQDQVAAAANDVLEVAEDD